MAQKKEDLPVNVDVDLENGGTITYATEVISTIAGVAANEIDGIAGMCISGGLSDIIGRNRNVTRGVKVDIGSEEASFDLFVIVEYGQPIQKVCHDVQENVRKAIESMTGLHVVRVDVHVQGVSFEKEKKQSEINIEAAKSPALTAGSAPKGASRDGKASKGAQKSRRKTPAPAPGETENVSGEVKEKAPAGSEAPDADNAPEGAAPVLETEAEKTEAEKTEAEKTDSVPEADEAVDAPEAAADEAPAENASGAEEESAEKNAGSGPDKKRKNKK